MIWNTLAYYRKQKSDAPAVLLTGGVITYRRFSGDVARVTHALRSRMPAGTRVAGVAVLNTYLHWLCIIALMRLRITSASLTREFDADLLGPDAMIVDEPTESALPVVQAEMDWLRQPLEASEFAERDDDTPFPIRLMGSSGTTGRPKRILFQSDLALRRITQVGIDIGVGPESRCAVLMRMASLGGFQLPLATWLRGGLVVLAKDPMFNPAIPDAMRPNLLVSSTGDYETMINRAPDGRQAFPGTRFLVGGSMVTPSVLARGRARLSNRIEILYGSTEMSMASMATGETMAPYSVGYPMPYVVAEIVDDEGGPVAEGEPGNLRMRSDFCVTGYEGDPETSAAAFKDGWFYSGDLARLTPDGQILLTGRASEMFNLGGRKLAPSVVEETVLACPGVIEAGSCKLRLGTGQAVAIAVRTDAAYDREATLAEISAKLGRARFLLFEVAEIPRNEMGKIRRDDLAGQIFALHAATVAARAQLDAAGATEH